MRQKCMTILKVSVALILALMMVVGSISTVVAATVNIEQAESGTDSAAAEPAPDEPADADDADDPGDAEPAAEEFSEAEETPAYKDENSFIRALKKGDFAGTGANVDLAESGDGTAHGKDYLILDYSGVTSGYYLKGVNELKNLAHNSWGDWITSYSVIGNKLYRIGVNHANESVAFKVVPQDSSNNEKDGAFIDCDGSNDTVIVTGDDAKTLTWGSTPQFRLMSGTGNADANTVLGNFSGSSNNYTLSVQLTAGTTYSLYILDTHSAKDWRNSSATIDRDNTTKSIYQYGGLNDCTDRVQSLTADITGLYTFTFKNTNNKLSVEFPPLERTGLSAVAMGSVDGTNFNTPLATINESFTANAAEGKSLTAPSIEGYTFVNWASSAGGTFTPNAATTTFKPAADSEIATAQYKKNYTVTATRAGTYGESTVTPSNANPVAGETYTVKATPATGYKLTSLTMNSGSSILDGVKYSEYTTSTQTASGDPANYTYAWVATFAACANPTVSFGSVGYDSAVTATAAGAAIESGASVYEGKALVFTRIDTPSGYRFDKWYSDADCTAEIKNGVGGYSLADSDGQTAKTCSYTIGASDTAVGAYAKFVKTQNVKYVKSGDGSGSVTGGGAAMTNNTNKTFDAGTDVALVATASEGSKFMGWYSDSSCKKLLTTDATYTISKINKDVTVYPYFGFKNYYLSGYLTLSHYATGSNFAVNPSNTLFTASETDPSIYTLELDIRGDQYAVVTNGSSMYPAAEEDQVSGTAAASLTTFAQGSSVLKWKAKVSGYKHITYVWNAVDKTLSWSTVSMPLEGKTIVLANTDKSWMYATSYTGDNANDTSAEDEQTLMTGSQQLSNWPKITKGGTEYYVIIFTDSEDLKAEGNNFYSLSLKNMSGSTDQNNYKFYGITPGHVSTVSYKNNTASSNIAVDLGTIAANSYAITLDDQDSANKLVDAQVDSSMEIEGQTITVTAKAKHGYDAVISVEKSGDPSTTVTPTVVSNGQNGADGKWTFSMPAYSVIVNVTYTKRATHSVTVKALAGGSVTVKDNGTNAVTTVNAKSKTVLTVIDGDTLTLTAKAKDDFKFKTWKEASSATTASITTSAIAADATYIAEFEEDPGTLVNDKYILFTSTNDITSNTKFTRIYYKGGHAYAYLDRADSFASGSDSTNGTFNDEFWFTLSSSKSSDNRWSSLDSATTGDAATAEAIKLTKTDWSSKSTIHVEKEDDDKFAAVQHIKIDLGAGTLSSSEFSFSYVGDPKFTVYATTAASIGDGEFDLYAKDGAVRKEGSTEFTTYASMADTKIYDVDGLAIGNDAPFEHETYKIDKGETVIIKTKIATAYASDYYVRGFLVNGVVPDGTLNTAGISGGTAVEGGVEYTLTYTCPEDFTGNINNQPKIEVTPIYYLADTTKNKTVTFYLSDFSPELQKIGADKANWGDTIYAYPFYGILSAWNNAFGQYPGQPMIYYKGQYSIQIPVYDTSPFDVFTGSPDNTVLNGATTDKQKTQRSKVRISGITLHNGYYDTVHRGIMAYPETDQSKYQTQTYDYDDFFKIYNEKEDVDNIYFQFKYETTTYNRTTSFTPADVEKSWQDHLADFEAVYQNGFEDLLNFHNRKVNIFSDAISGNSLTNNPLIVVSRAGDDSGVSNVAGHYATEWRIYVPTNKTGNTKYTLYSAGDKDAIPPSLLQLNNELSFNNDTYPSAVSTYKVTDWLSYYKGLNYEDYPVKITYEKVNSDVDGDKAARNDGRWLYSSLGENITSTIKVEVRQQGASGYVENGVNGVDIDGLDAFFTNSGAEGERTCSTFIDPDKEFNFSAISHNPDYRFDGWYFADGNLITTSSVGSTERSGNYTLIARFSYVSIGQLKLSHVVDTTARYKGNGKTYMSVVVTNAEGTEIKKVYNTTEDDILISQAEDIIDNGKKTDKIKITLSAVPSGEDKFALVSTDADNKFFGNSNNYTVMPGQFEFTVGDLFDDNDEQTVKSITYKSYFTAATYNYSLKYSFTGKLMDISGNRVTNTYNKVGTLTPAQSREYVEVDDYGNKCVTSKFLTDFAPVEVNYGEDITWSVPDSSAMKFSYDKASNTYTLRLDGTNDTPVISAANTSTLTDMTVTFNLPYYYNSEGIVKRIKDSEVNYDSYVATGLKTDNKYGKDQIPYRVEVINYTIDVPYGMTARNLDVVDELNAAENVTDKYTIANTGYGGEYYSPDYYVTAPMELIDTNTLTNDDTRQYEILETKKYFQYWSIYSPSDGKEVARCYTNRFTFSALNNYTVTPIYEAQSEGSVDHSNEIIPTIAYLGPSRNQWNNGGYDYAAAITNPDARTASDLLFQDFVMSYNYMDQDLYTGEIAGVETGYVVERIEALEFFDEGKTKANTNTFYYANKYSDDADSDTENIKAAINGTDSYSGRTSSKLSKYTFDNSSLSEKGRIQCFYSVYNSRGWADDNPDDFVDGRPATKYTYKNYIYRAFSYIKDANDGNKVYLSEPVYFTFFDIAQNKEV